MWYHGEMFRQKQPTTCNNSVIGWPISHSQSPKLHQYLYQSLGIDAVMLPLSHPTLPPLVQAIKTLKVELTAVTAPFKEDIMDYLDVCSEASQAIQAVNTVIQRADRKLYGYNTDVDGIAYALRSVSLADKQVLIIGAGGAARAAAYVAQQNGARLFCLNRTRARAEALTRLFSGEVITQHQVREIAWDVIIQTTPVGTFPHVKDSPLPHYPWTSQQVVFDMVYNPMRTALLKCAEKAGARTLSGMDMFVVQAVHQVALWQQIDLTLPPQNDLRST